MATKRTPPDPVMIEKTFMALEEFLAQGRSQVVCEVCGHEIAIQRLGESAYSVRCRCGRYHDTLRGV